MTFWRCATSVAFWRGRRAVTYANRHNRRIALCRWIGVVGLRFGPLCQPRGRGPTAVGVLGLPRPLCAGAHGPAGMRRLCGRVANTAGVIRRQYSGGHRRNDWLASCRMRRRPFNWKSKSTLRVQRTADRVAPRDISAQHFGVINRADGNHCLDRPVPGVLHQPHGTIGDPHAECRCRTVSLRMVIGIS